jgi:primase-polymerase (primpol)-like protein
MSTRAQVKIKDTGVYLYQHWDGDMLEDIVRSALAREERWDNEEYLTRIIFCEMIKDNLMDSTGYGIGTSEHGDIEYLIEVDVKNQMVTVKDYNLNDQKSMGFETFVNEAVK